CVRVSAVRSVSLADLLVLSIHSFHSSLLFFFFFFNDTAPPEIYPLSLHDALPISPWMTRPPAAAGTSSPCPRPPTPRSSLARRRSEEHTSELQSLTNLVCRLLLEKKKTQVRSPMSTATPIPQSICTSRT